MKNKFKISRHTSRVVRKKNKKFGVNLTKEGIAILIKARKHDDYPLLINND